MGEIGCAFAKFPLFWRMGAFVRKNEEGGRSGSSQLATRLLVPEIIPGGFSEIPIPNKAAPENSHAKNSYGDICESIHIAQGVKFTVEIIHRALQVKLLEQQIGTL